MSEIEQHVFALLQASFDGDCDFTVIPNHKVTDEPIGVVYVTTTPENIKKFQAFFDSKDDKDSPND